LNSSFLTYKTRKSILLDPRSSRIPKRFLRSGLVEGAEGAWQPGSGPSCHQMWGSAALLAWGIVSKPESLGEEASELARHSPEGLPRFLPVWLLCPLNSRKIAPEGFPRERKL